MKIIIAAIGNNNELGFDNKLLWKQSDDLKRFKELTLHKTIVMGRKTFESLPGILPNRNHIIVSKQNKIYDGCSVMSDINSALNSTEEIYIIGGGEIFYQTIDQADRLEITRIEADFNADAFFPHIDPKKWLLTKSNRFERDDKNQFDYSFDTYIRK